MYTQPIKPNEIYHYGVQGKSGRYPWGSGDRPYQRLEGKAGRMERRLEKKFKKADAKTAKLQTKANKKFNKANVQRNSMLKSRRKKAEQTFNEGYKIQEKKQRIEYKMSKKYERYKKKFTKLDVKMDSALQTKGLDYYNKVLANTDSQYKAALAKRVS